MKAGLLICDFGVAALFVWALNWLALIPFRRSRGKNWTERARVLYPERVGVIMERWKWPRMVAMGQRLLFEEEAPHWLLSGLAAWAGAVAGAYFFAREVYPEATLKAWLHEMLAHWGLRFVWLGLFVGIAVLMPAELDWRNWVLGALMIATYVGWAFGGLIWCWKKTHLLKPASDRLQGIVRDVSSRMNVRVRGVWLLHSIASTAYALPYTGDLIFSERLVDSIPDDEIASVAAHELGHLNESRLMWAARLAKSLGTMPFLFIKPLFQHFGMASVFMAGAAYWIVSLWSRDLSHRLEVKADRAGKENEGDEGVYARALARLYEINLLPAVIRKKQTHPHLYDRLVSAGFNRIIRVRNRQVRSRCTLFCFGWR